MAGFLVCTKFDHFIDDDGTPVANGSVEFDLEGTTTDATVYEDLDLMTSLGSTVTLDSVGRPINSGGDRVSIYANTANGLKITLKDSSGTTVDSVDEFSVALGSNALQPIISYSGSGDGTANADIAMGNQDLKFNSGAGIYDDSDNEYHTFTKVSNAVNYLDTTNAATGSGPILSAKGDNTNIDLKLNSKGSGVIDANASVQSAGDVIARGDGSSTAGAITLYDNDRSNYLTLRASGTISSDQTLVVPGGDGSNGQCWTTDGSGTLAWNDAGMHEYNSAVADTSGASYKITGLDSSDSFVLYIDQWVPATDDVELQMLVYDDGGTTPITTSSYNYMVRVNTASDSQIRIVSTGGTTSVIGAVTTSTEGISNVAAEGGISGFIRFYHTDQTTTRFKWSSRFEYINADSEICTSIGSGFINAAVDAILLQFTSGNIASGRLVIWDFTRGG